MGKKQFPIDTFNPFIHSNNFVTAGKHTIAILQMLPFSCIICGLT